jgi:hypothetical protein
MRIELIGCTSAGKSTLASNILRICRDQELDAWMGYDFVLRQVRLDWVKSKLMRGLAVNLIALFVCAVTYRNQIEFYRFVIRFIARLPPTVTRAEKLYIGRDVLKNIGIYEIIHRRAADRQIILLDEGTLHTAHYLFVHVSVELESKNLAAFVRLVPLPDVVVYVTQSESVLIERTLERGHKRIPDRSYANVQRFVKRAVAIFDEMAQQPTLESRLLIFDNQRSSIAEPGDPVYSLFDAALRIVRFR